MRIFETTSTFQHPWNQTIQAVLQKYPNPQSTHVLSEDTLSRHVDCEGKLISTKILTKTNPMPKWGEKLLSARKVVVVETSEVDIKNRTYNTRTFNIGLNKYMSVIEHVMYRRSDSDLLGCTIAERKAEIDSHVFGFNYAIQKFGVDRYKRNVQKTDAGINYVTSNLFPRSSTNIQAASKTLVEKANLAKKLLVEKKDKIVEQQEKSKIPIV